MLMQFMSLVLSLSIGVGLHYIPGWSRSRLVSILTTLLSGGVI